MKKKALSLLLALALTVGLVPSALAAEEAETERGVLTYTEVITPQYEAAGRFSDDLAPVKKDGKWGYIDTDGNVVIDFQYEMAYIFSEGLAVVAKSKRTETNDWASWTYYEMGFIDEDGTYTPFTVRTWDMTTETYQDTPLEMHEDYLSENNDAFIFHNGFILIADKADIEPKYHNTSGAELNTDNGYDYVRTNINYYPFNEGLAPIWIEGSASIGYIDTNGKLVKKFSASPGNPEYLDSDHKIEQYISNALPFNQGLAPVFQYTHNYETGEITYLMGFIDRNFEWVIQPQFNGYYYSGVNTTYQFFGTTGLAMVAKDGKYGAIDKSGNTVIPFQYEELWPVSDGLIPFMENGKYGYLDAATLETAIPTQYEKASGFSELGLAVAYDGQKAFLIDKKGNPVPGADTLDSSTYFIENENGSKTVYEPGEYVVIQKDGKYGYGHIEYLPALPDISEMDPWAYDEVVAAIEENLVPLSLQNLYRNNITRQEFCDVAMQTVTEILDTDVEDLVLERSGQTLTSLRQEYPFIDTTDSSVVAANALGIINGRGNRIFDPYTTITREEAAALLTRAAKVLGMDTENATAASFADNDKVSAIFRNEVNFVNQINVMSGMDNNMFTPQGTYNREQSFVTVYRLFQAVMDQIDT